MEARIRAAGYLGYDFEIRELKNQNGVKKTEKRDHQACLLRTRFSVFFPSDYHSLGFSGFRIPCEVASPEIRASSLSGSVNSPRSQAT